MRRKLLQGVSLAILAVALLLALILVSPQMTRPVIEPLRVMVLQLVMGRVSTSIHGALEIGALRGSLFGDPVAEDIVLQDAAGKVIARIDAIRLSYTFGELFLGRFHIHSLEIVNPWLKLIETPDGGLNIVQALTPTEPDEDEEESFPLTVSMDHIELRDGRLALQIPSLRGVSSVKDITLALRAEIDRQGVALELHRLTARAQPADVVIESARGGLRMQSGEVQFQELMLRTAATRITLDGSLPAQDRLADLVLQFQPLDVSEVGRLLDDESLHGDVRLKLSAEGPGKAVEIDGRLETGSGHIALSGSVDAVASPPRYTAQLDVAQLDLSCVSARPGLESDLNAWLRVQGKGFRPAKLEGELNIAIDDSHLGAIAFRPSRIQLQAREERIRIDTFDLDSSIARMSMRGGLDFTGTSDLHYRLSAKLSDLHQLLEVERLEGELDVQGTAVGVWPQLTARGHIKAEGLRYEDYGLEVLDVDYAALHLGVAPSIESRWTATRLNIDDISVQHAVIQADYDVQAKKLSLDTELQQSQDYQGRAVGSLVFGNDGQRLAVEELDLQLQDRLWASTTPWELSLGPGRIAVQSLRLAHGEELIALSGDIHDRQFRDVSLQTRNLDLEFLKRLLKLPDTVSGRADLQARLQGDFDVPQFEGDLKVVDIPEQHLPFSRLQLRLDYGNRRIYGRLGLQQRDTEVLSLVLEQPVDLVLTDLPLERRLLEGPVSAHLELKQLDVGPFQASSEELEQVLLSVQTALQDFLVIQPQQFVVLPADFPVFPDLPDLPEIEGPLQGIVEGNLDLNGTYEGFSLQANVQVIGLGIENAIERIHGPLSLNADVEMADSLAELRQAIDEGQLAPTISHLRVHTPLIEGHLPVQGTDGRLEIRDLQLEANAALRHDGLRAQLQGFQLQARIPSFPITDLTFAAELSPQALTLTRLRVATPRSEVDARGDITLPGQNLSLAVDIDPLMLNEFLPDLATAWPAEVRGSVRLKGTLQSPRAEVRLDYASASINADLEAQLAQKIPGYSAQLGIDGLDLANFSPGLTGRFTATAGLQGEGFTEQDRKAQLSVDIGSADFKLAPELDLRMRSDIKGAEAIIEEFALNSTTLQVALQGLVSTREQTALIYNIDLGDLTPLREYLGVELQAEGALSGEFRGGLEDLHTQGTLYLNDLRYGDVRGERLLSQFVVKDLLSVGTATLDLQLVGIQTPTLPRSSVQLEGEYKEGRGEFSLAVGEGPFKASRIEGVLLEEHGYLLTLDHVHLQSEEEAWRNSAPVRIHYGKDGEIELEQSQLQNDGQTITALGKLSAQGHVSAELNIDDMQIRSVIQTLAADFEPPDGKISLDLRLDGTLQQPGLKASMKLDDLRRMDESLGEISAEASSTGTVYNGSLRWTRQNEALLRLNGSVDSAAKGDLDMWLQSAGFDLARLAPLSDAIVQSAGVLEVDLHLVGTVQNPQAHGQIMMRDTQLRLLATGEHYSDVRANLRFNGTRAEVKEFHVGSSTGDAQLQGWLEFGGYELSGLELTLDADEFTAMNTPAISAKVNADLRLQGSQDDMSLSGNLTVPQARIRIDNLPTSDSADVEPWQLTVSGVYGPGPEHAKSGDGKALGPEKKAPLPFLRSDIQVDIPKNVWVQGEGTAVELFGDVQIHKKLQEPFVLGGYVETLRGFASFLGKKFDIEKGRVDFTGSQRIDPELNITATQQVSDYTVYVDVTGRSKKPELNFRSTPELEQADIISLLVFGKTTDRLSGSEQSNLSNKAGQLAGSMAAGVLEGILGKSFGLDVINIDPGIDESASSFGVGRYITQDLYLSYDRIIRDPKKDNRGGNTVNLEYSISRNFKIEASSSDIGETALDFNWTFDY